MINPSGPDRPFELPFERGIHFGGDRLLHRSPKFTVRSSWETVFLEGQELTGLVKIGDFFPQPSASAINADETWCVTVGCGIVAYRLEGPWEDYEYRSQSKQWWEYRRGPSRRELEPSLWIDCVEALSGNEFSVMTTPDAGWLVQELLVDPELRDVSVLQEWVDEALGARTKALHSFAGQRVADIEVGDDGIRFFLGGDRGSDHRYEFVVAGPFTLTWFRPPQEDTVIKADARACDETSSVIQALRRNLSRQVHQFDSREDGSLFVALADEELTASRFRPLLRINVPASARSAWLARTPDYSIECPGPEGWPDGRPPR